jgi:signal transduction histidine kinase
LETPKREPVDIDILTETIVSDIQKIYQQKNIRLTTHLQKNTSKKIHRESWNIIIKNILENAYKFTPE